MSDVFLSYAREDIDAARDVAAQLEAAGFSVWWDRELKAGDDFSRRIEQVLGRVGCVVVLWSEHSVASEWVRAEANEARERGKLIPLTLDDTQPPLVFRNLHTVSLAQVQTDDTEWNELVEAVRERQGPAAQTDGETPARRKRRGPLTPKHLLGILAGLVVVSLGAIAGLDAVHKATVVELELTLEEAAFTVTPPTEPPALGSLALLSPDLRVTTLQWKGFDAFEATLLEPLPGRATAVPGGSGTIGLRSTTALQPHLRLLQPAPLELLPSGRGVVTIAIGPAGGPAGWRCEVLPREDLELRLQDVELTAGGERLTDPEVRLEPNATAIVFRGGGGRAELGLRPTAESGPLLAPDLPIAAPAFYRFDAEQRERSFVAGGRISFPRGEKSPVEIAAGALLRVPDTAALTLKSIQLRGGYLKLIISGELASVRLGPTLELMDELLPSLFEWLVTHQPLVLAFGVLTVLITIVLGLFQLLGLVKKQ